MVGNLHIKQRGVVLLAATLVAAAGGVPAGFLLARAIVLHVAEARLTDRATRSLAVVDANVADVHKTLAAMNTSPYPYCSDSELSYFRHILLHSDYLKEGGRMTDGRIDCSTNLDRNELSKEQFKPIYFGKKGFRVYWNLAPFHNCSQAAPVIQAGTSYVYMAINMHGENLPTGANLKMTLRDIRGQPIIPSINRNSTSLIEDSYRHVGGLLSATRCSTRFPLCVTGEIPVTDAFHIGLPIFAWF
jgi:sensor c-di-GMP phosphodiesterase-like protein